MSRRSAMSTTVDALAPIADPVLRARARHVVSENERVLTVASLLRHGRVQDIGPLLTASHRSLRDDFAVSTDALDLVVSSALDAGALGGTGDRRRLRRQRSRPGADGTGSTSGRCCAQNPCVHKGWRHPASDRCGPPTPRDQCRELGVTGPRHPTVLGSRTT